MKVSPENHHQGFLQLPLSGNASCPKWDGGKSAGVVVLISNNERTGAILKCKWFVHGVDACISRRPRVCQCTHFRSSTNLSLTCLNRVGLALSASSVQLHAMQRLKKEMIDELRSGMKHMSLAKFLEFSSGKLRVFLSLSFYKMVTFRDVLY